MRHHRSCGLRLRRSSRLGGVGPFIEEPDLDSWIRADDATLSDEPLGSETGAEGAWEVDGRDRLVCSEARGLDVDVDAGVAESEAVGCEMAAEGGGVMLDVGGAGDGEDELEDKDGEDTAGEMLSRLGSTSTIFFTPAIDGLAATDGFSLVTRVCAYDRKASGVEKGGSRWLLRKDS